MSQDSFFVKGHTKFKNPCYTMRVSGVEDLANSFFAEECSIGDLGSVYRSAFPLMWECVGGSALKGEDSLSAALRETEEEVGVRLSSGDGKIIYSEVGRIVNGVKFSDIVDVWLFEYNGPVNLESATTREVARTVWMKKPEIRRLFDNGKLVNTLGYFFELENV